MAVEYCYQRKNINNNNIFLIIKAFDYLCDFVHFCTVIVIYDVV